MSEKNIIKTGVDKLLEIVKEKKRISIDDAAKNLGVSKDIASEWGDFLEDEGYITKEYKFTNTFLVIKSFDIANISKKAIEIDEKKREFCKKS
jgi:DeoR/GlpR family transcriptional regulator of sugar metabolism